MRWRQGACRIHATTTTRTSFAAPLRQATLRPLQDHSMQSARHGLEHIHSRPANENPARSTVVGRRPVRTLHAIALLAMAGAPRTEAEAPEDEEEEAEETETEERAAMRALVVQLCEPLKSFCGSATAIALREAVVELAESWWKLRQRRSGVWRTVAAAQDELSVQGAAYEHLLARVLFRGQVRGIEAASHEARQDVGGNLDRDLGRTLAMISSTARLGAEEATFNIHRQRMLNPRGLRGLAKVTWWT